MIARQKSAHRFHPARAYVIRTLGMIARQENAHRFHPARAYVIRTLAMIARQENAHRFHPVGYVRTRIRHHRKPFGKDLVSKRM